MNYIAPRAEPLIRKIPLSRLALAPENVRKTPPDSRADAELKASIAALGLLENLVIRNDEDDRYAVVAGVGGSTHHAGQPLDPVKLAQRRLRQHRRDGLPQSVVIHRLRQTACKPRRQLLEGHDLQPVPQVPAPLPAAAPASSGGYAR